MTQLLRATAAPSREDTFGGFATLEVGTHLIPSNRIGLETVEGGRATLRRDVLTVIAFNQIFNGDGRPVIEVVVNDDSGHEEKLVTDTSGRLRDYTRVLVRDALQASADVTA